MKRIASFLLSFFLLSACIGAQNAAPVIQNFSATVDWPTHSLTLKYDLSDPDDDPIDITVALSDDGGKTYALTASVPASGDTGFPVMPGAGKTITCDVSALIGAGAEFTVRLVADDKQPFDLQQLVDQVDSSRLRADLGFVEGIRHRTAGLPHLNAVRDSLESLFLQTELHTTEQAFAYGAYTGRNVLGTAPGTVNPNAVVIVDAHYDSVSNAPGADDNGSGTVGVMEIARLLGRYPTKKTMRYIGFDLEEAGLVGSSRYVSGGLAAGEMVECAFNFEMIGYFSNEPNTQTAPVGFNLLFPAAYNQLVADSFRGNFITNVGNSDFQGVIALFKNSATTYVPDLKVISIAMPTDFPVPDLLRSDHAPFWSAQLPALMLTDGADFRNACYHKPCDTLENRLNFRFMSNVVKATLAAAAELAQVQHGDWAVAQFEGTVGTADPFLNCQVSAARSGYRGIQCFFGECPLRQVQLELFDTRGSLLYRETVNDPPQQRVYTLSAPELSAGLYFVKFSAPEGSRTVKVTLP